LKRALVLFSLSAMLWLGPCLAQQGSTAHESTGESSGEAHHDPVTGWKWINFAILTIALGYLISKKGGAFFDSRTRAVRESIAAAEQLRKEAEARAAEMQGRLDSLGAEIEELRRRAGQEMAAEGERVRRETEEGMKKIHAQAEHAIDAAVKSARQELKAYSALLALQVAEQKIRSRLTPDVEARLVRSFVTGLESHSDGRPEQGVG
jgi:F-type H+-transporting ATPase subunit b